MKTLNSNIQDYIDIVRSNKIAVCKEQLQFCDLVERIFRTEKLTVNEKQLDDYLSLQKYFPYKLFEWERCCFALHNCVYREDGQLRFPDLFIFVGRGAGKNGYLAFEDFCLLTPINGVQQYHIDICANSEDQAKTTFDDIYNILEDNKRILSRYFKWNKEIIENIKTKSRLQYRTNNAKTKDGSRPGKVDFDEYHAFKDYKNIEVFETGLGKKKFPRTTIASTNGEVRDGPLDDILATSNQILSGEIPDDGMMPFICKLDNKQEVHKKQNWIKANPSLPYLPNMQNEMDKEYKKYCRSSIGNTSFMTKRMNLAVGATEETVTSWENILATKRKIPDLSGLPCVWGIDYAQTTDFVAVGCLYKVNDIYYWITHTWVCKECNDLKRIKFPLEQAQEQGLLTFVDDVEIAPEIPVRWLQERAENSILIKGGLDTFRHSLISRALKEAGFSADKRNGNIKLLRPSDQMMVSPLISSAFINHKIIWGDNPLMRWYTNNTKQVLDNKGNIHYEKIEPKSRKTDGFMAFVAAMACADILEEKRGYGGALPDVFVY